MSEEKFRETNEFVFSHSPSMDSVLLCFQFHCFRSNSCAQWKADNMISSRVHYLFERTAFFESVKKYCTRLCDRFTNLNLKFAKWFSKIFRIVWKISQLNWDRLSQNHRHGQNIWLGLRKKPSIAVLIWNLWPLRICRGAGALLFNF